MKEAVDSIAGSESTAVVPESLGAVILGQLQAMQKSLKDDQELQVLCTIGADTLRVFEVYVPSWKVVVLTGAGADKALTRVVSPFESLQFVCKPVQAQPGAKPMRIRFVTPKPE